MKRLFLLIITAPLIILLIAGCIRQPVQPKIIAECSKDSNCTKAGCSSSICTTVGKEKEIYTTCEAFPGHECYQEADCGCVDGKCQWDDQEKLDICLAVSKE